MTENILLAQARRILAQVRELDRLATEFQAVPAEESGDVFVELHGEIQILCEDAERLVRALEQPGPRARACDRCGAQIEPGDDICRACAVAGRGI